MCASQPKRVGIKAGCFTLLHAGHMRALRYAKEKCDHLIVLTSTDDRIADKKGCVPVSINDRIDILMELKCVDEVSFFSHLTEEIWVQEFKEERLYKEFGNDAKLLVFHDPVLKSSSTPPCQSIADEIVFIPYWPREGKRSVSDMFQLIKDYGKI